jgi:hypothetical protein
MSASARPSLGIIEDLWDPIPLINAAEDPKAVNKGRLFQLLEKDVWCS